MIRSNALPHFRLSRCLTVFLLASVLSVQAVRADTTFDCPRFFLKYDPKSDQMKCVSKPKKRKGGASDGVQALINKQQRLVARQLQAAKKLLDKPFVSETDRDRIRELLNDVKVRIRQIKARTRQLIAEQQSYTAGVLADQRQRVSEQKRMTARLIAQQEALTQRLMSQQKALTRQLKPRRIPKAR